MMMKKFTALILITAFCSAGTFSQETGNYGIPPKNVTDLILAPATPLFSLSPSKDRYLVIRIDNIPTIREQMRDELKLAGRRVLAATNGPKTRTKIKELEIKSLHGQKGMKEGTVQGFPEDVTILDYEWSPNGKNIAACVEDDDGIRLWTVNTDNLTASKLSDRKLNMFFGTKTYEWTPDGTGILALLVPEDRGAAPVVNFNDITPVIQESHGKVSPTPTHQDLLTDKFSEQQFDYYASSELGIIPLKGDNIRTIGEKSIYVSATCSPDGNHILVKTVGRPYSYVVPYTSFPSTIKILDTGGREIKLLNQTPLIEYKHLGKNSVSPEPRFYSWRADKPSSVCWVEPLDGGNGKATVEFRDRLVCLDAPFNALPIEIYKAKARIADILWGDADNAFVTTIDRETKLKECTQVDPSTVSIKRTIYSQSFEDLYADYGRIISDRNSFGKKVAFSADGYNTIYFDGNGYSPKGAYPFIDARNLAKKTVKRIWQSQDPYYEVPVAYTDLVNGEFITQRESNEVPPNFYLRNIKKKKDKPLTFFGNPYPAIKGVTKQVVEYTRKDGIKLSGTLYLPAGYKKGDGPLPVLLWAYPSEFKDSGNAGQRSDAPNEFIRYTRTSPVLWVAEGYAVLNNASFPIIGEEDEEPNDTYIEQLVSNAAAAIDKLVEMGVGDRNRFAVGGHSYGAFMTANLLANSDLFAAGIARSGAYNRTLTPFGFQNETRTFWEAPDVYLKMSPFVKADKLKAPILLIHGQSDNNTGTFTMQSERLYTALKGNGGTVRLVLLPYESHGYVAKESILHQAWETWQWLEKYVKNRN